MTCLTCFIKAVLRSALPILAVFAFGFGDATPADRRTTTELVDRIVAAKAAFVPVTDEHVSSALDRVKRSLRRIHEFVDRDPPVGCRWKKYLRSNEQIHQIEQGTDGDTEFWEKILRRVTIDSAGLDEDVFREYRSAVRDLIGVLQARQVPDLRAEYEATLDRLVVALPAFSENPTRAQADEISTLLTLLYRRHQATGLVHAVRQPISHPNVVVSIPVDMVRAQVVGKTETTVPVNDVIDGAQVRGSSRMTAERAAVFPESDDSLQMEIKVSGVSNSHTQSYRQGVTTYNSGRLTFASSGALEFNERGFEISPFVTTATLQTRFLDVSTPFGTLRHLVARRMARDRQPIARREAESKAIRQLSVGFAEELRMSLNPWIEKYLEKVRRPLLRCDLFPSTSNFGIRNKRIELEYLFDLGYRLAAYDPPPAGNYANDAFSVSIHESAFNNSFSSSMAMRRMSLTGVFRGMFGHRDVSENGNDEAPLYLTFAHQRPLTLAFDDHLLTLALNVQEFESAGQRYAAMEIQLKYQLDKEDAQWVLHAHDPTVWMPRRAGGSRPQLGIRNYSLRRILLNTLARDQPPRLFMEEIIASLVTVNSVQLEDIQIKNGWLQFNVQEVN